MLQQETSCFAAGRSSWFLKKPQFHFRHFAPSIPRNLRIDLDRPAFDAACHRFCALDTLLPEPHRGIEAAHSVVAIANHFVRIEQRIQVGWERTEWDQLCAWNLAKVVFPLRADIDQQQFVAAHDAFVYFLRRDLHIIHLVSWPERSTLPRKRAN